MQHRMVFFVVAVAVILAIAGFLLISFLTRGGEPAVETPIGQPAGNDVIGELPAGVPVQVDGTTVYLQTVPEKVVSLSQAPPVTEPTVAGTLLPPLPTNTLEPVTVEPALPTAAPPVAPSGDQVIFVDYVVQPGDTLYRIAEKQATSIELMAVHGISSEDLVPGTTLRLPVANPAVCPGTATYVVRPGDTVFSIAQRYNTTTQAIASANGLGPDFRIDVAQVLCIP
ncbi:MAG TPA: LysM peptidoglycan-binding domain-containing protein [Candidatus Binatia bacterium]|nr:LysM peptidoglycan-binding domain-containing protein [Candidatus Binatia bacterium]